MGNHEIVQADLVKWLRGHQWMAGTEFMPKFHAILGDTPYFLGSINKRFGGAAAAPAQYGADGSFARLSKGFMGKSWDGFESVWHYQAWITEWARLLLDFAHPGAVLLLFGGTRTYHRVAAGLEDAGWIVADGLLAWMYGSGFPKSYNYDRDIADPAWHGYSQALKPSYEPIILARAPRGKYTYAQLAQELGTGGLNVDACRASAAGNTTFVERIPGDRSREQYRTGTTSGGSVPSDQGRYPANTVLVCSCGTEHEPGCPVRALDEQSGDRPAGSSVRGDEPSNTGNWGIYSRYERQAFNGYEDEGGASRFFYCAKAHTSEREWGLESFTPRTVNDGRETPIDNPYQRGETERLNTHPTVKPVRLAEWLSRLVLPPALNVPRRILIPFAGVASEMIGAHLAGWDEIVGIERESEYVDIARVRMSWWSQFAAYEQAEAAAAVQVARRQVAAVSGVVQMDMFAGEGNETE